MKSAIFFFRPASRSLRHTKGSEGINGEVQITRISLALSGAVLAKRCRFSLLLVAACTNLLATARALASWLALRTVLKHFLGSMLRAEKMKVVGTRKPEVEFGSPMPKSRLASHFKTSSSVLSGLSLCTMMCDQ